MEQQCVRQHVQKPRLEIPDSTKLSPRNASFSSPRSLHGFPTSPEWSGDGKSFEDWPGRSPNSVLTRSPRESDAAPGGVERKRQQFYVGEFVLVRCNHTKWLLGQVRRTSRNGVIVWVGAAQTLVNVPYELLASHLVKLDSPSLPTSPRSSLSSEDVLDVGRDGRILAPFQCVRPAHLSHRKLYQPLKFAGKEACPVTVQNEVSTSEVRDHRSCSLPGSSSGNSDRVKDNEVASEPSYSLCRFKFSEDDASSLSRTANKSASIWKQRGFESGEQLDWITVIENGMDIRRSQCKY